MPDAQAGIAAVTSGRADAFVIGQFSVPNSRDRGVDIIVDKVSPMAAVAIAFRKEDAGTRDMINSKIAEMRSNGMLKTFYEKNGFNNWDVLSKAIKPSDIAPDCE